MISKQRTGLLLVILSSSVLIVRALGSSGATAVEWQTIVAALMLLIGSGMFLLNE